MSVTEKQLKTMFEDIGKNWETFKAENDERLSVIEKNGGVAELDEKLVKIEAAMTEVTGERDTAVAERKVMSERVDAVEASLDGLGTRERDKKRQDLVGYKEKFNEWMRSTVQYGGKMADPELSRELVLLARDIPEYKDINTGVGATGGFAVPEEIAREIHDQTRLLSPLRDLARVVQIGTSDYKELVNIHGENSAWVGEAGARSTGTTPSFRERAPTLGTLYSYPRATEESVDDVFFNVGQLLIDVTSVEHAIAEGIAWLTGSGTNRPTGIFNTAPVVTDDDASPPRSAEAIEYVPLDLSTPTTAIDPDQLLTIIYLLRASYRLNAWWAFNSSVTGVIRKLKDTQNQYLWAPGLVAGQPDRLLGYPVRTLEAMDDASTVNNLPILFGDFRRGYLIVDRVGLRITVDDNITVPGFIQWYIRKRVGGILLDNNALKAGKFSSS